MLTGMRRRLSYANVIASLALFIALGGASYAASIAPRNSVRSSSIKNGQVKTADLGANAVTSGKIRNGTVSAADLSASLKTDLADASTVNGLSTAQIVAAAGGEYTEARQAAGSKDIETLTPQDLVTLNLPHAGKYLVTARVPVTCTYDGSDGATPAAPNPQQPFFVAKGRLLVNGTVVESQNQTCEAEGGILVVLASTFFGTATVEFSREITVGGPSTVTLQGLAETSIALFVSIPAGARITAGAQNAAIQAVTVHA